MTCKLWGKIPLTIVFTSPILAVDSTSSTPSEQESKLPKESESLLDSSSQTKSQENEIEEQASQETFHWYESTIFEYIKELVVGYIAYKGMNKGLKGRDLSTCILDSETIQEGKRANEGVKEAQNKLAKRLDKQSKLSKNLGKSIQRLKTEIQETCKASQNDKIQFLKKKLTACIKKKKALKPNKYWLETYNQLLDEQVQFSVVSDENLLNAIKEIKNKSFQQFILAECIMKGIITTLLYAFLNHFLNVSLYLLFAESTRELTYMHIVYLLLSDCALIPLSIMMIFYLDVIYPLIRVGIVVNKKVFYYGLLSLGLILLYIIYDTRIFLRKVLEEILLFMQEKFPTNKTLLEGEIEVDESSDFEKLWID